MARRIRYSELETRAARDRLRVGKYHHRALAPGKLAIGYRRAKKGLPGIWYKREYMGADAHGIGHYRCTALGTADDYADADGVNVLSYAQALLTAQEAGKLNRSTARDISSRWADFIARGITPTCYLYRHYDYQDDLLYVGLSNTPLKRQRKHRDGSHWAAMVCTITIEPFATREEVIAAEQWAIETEHPRYNQTYNGRALPRVVMKIMEAG